jgi:hypothetical protein
MKGWGEPTSSGQLQQTLNRVGPIPDSGPKKFNWRPVAPTLFQNLAVWTDLLRF